MQSNALQATLLQAPETLKAKEIGLRPLLDFTKLDVEWQQNGVASTRDYIKKKPDTVRRFMRAYVEAVRLQPDQSQRVAKGVAKVSGDQRRKIGRRSVQRNRRQADSQSALSHRAGYSALSRSAERQKSQSRASQTPDFTDISFLKELESSGFIDKLYK